MKRWNGQAVFRTVLILSSSVLLLYGTIFSPSEHSEWQAVPTLLAGMFPWTGLLLKSCKDGICESRTEDLRRNVLLLLWGIAVLAACSLCHMSRAIAMILSFPAFAVLIGWNMERMIREDKTHFAGWAFWSGFTFVTAAVLWFYVGQQLPELNFVAVIAGTLTILLGAGIGVALLYYKDGVLAALLHAASGFMTMILLYYYLLPAAAHYYKAEEMIDTIKILQ